MSSSGLRGAITGRDWLQRHDALLGRWRERVQRLFRDGAVEHESYSTVSRRIVYVLKEVNVSPDEPVWELRDLLLGAQHGRTWNMVAYWTHGLLSGLSKWSDVPQATQDFRRKWLSRVAVVNINKSGGGARSKAGLL